MRRIFKSFLICFLVITLLSTTAFAVSNAKTIEAILNSINIKVNGTQVAKVGDTYTLSNGKQVPFSISYQGTTYLPLRKVAELVNKNVTYDSKTITAEISNLAGSEYLPPITFTSYLTYDAKGVPLLNFTAYNVSGKDIKYFEINAICYNDKFIPITYKDSGDNIFVGTYTEVLKAGEISSENYYTLSGLEGTTISYLILSKVEFSDGTIWQ